MVGEGYEKEENCDLVCLILFAAVAILTPVLYLAIKDNEQSYIGYDGYIWKGAKRTEQRSNQAMKAEAFENTIDITGDMSKYFDKGYVDLSSNRLALMPHYLKNVNMTLFSGVKVKKIVVYAKNSGSLMIGTAKVSDVIEARKNGGDCLTTAENYEVNAGKCEIVFETPLSVMQDETIVLGGEGSVSLFYLKDIPVNDEAGNFLVRRF